MVVSLKKRSAELAAALQQNDQRLYLAFLQMAQQRGETGILRNHYQAYYDFDAGLDKELEIYNTMNQLLQFTNEVTPVEQIRAKFSNLEPYEQILREKLQHMLYDSFYSVFLAPLTLDHFERYLSKEWRYFGTENYFAESLNVLFLALEYYKQAIFQAHFQYRKRLLDYQASLVG